MSRVSGVPRMAPTASRSAVVLAGGGTKCSLIFPTPALSRLAKTKRAPFVPNLTASVFYWRRTSARATSRRRARPSGFN